MKGWKGQNEMREGERRTRTRLEKREGDQTMPGFGTDTKLALLLIDSKR